MSKQISARQLLWWLDLSDGARERLMTSSLKSVLGRLYEDRVFRVGNRGTVILEGLFTKFDHLSERLFKSPLLVTEEKIMEVYELKEDADHATIFGAFGREFSELCLSREQIAEFCLIHRDKLVAGYGGTLFLSKYKIFNVDEYLVVFVRLDGAKCKMFTSRLEDANLEQIDWGHYRVVVPRPA